MNKKNLKCFYFFFVCHSFSEDYVNYVDYVTITAVCDEKRGFLDS